MFSTDLCQPARGGNFVIGFININKDTSSFENVYLCLRKNRQLGHISVATGRISSLLCTISINHGSYAIFPFCSVDDTVNVKFGIYVKSIL